MAALLGMALLARRRGWPWHSKSRHKSQDDARAKQHKAKKLSTSVPACALCERCSRLDLESMFTRETTEQALGPLPNFASAGCGFCALISDAIGSTLGEGWDARKLSEAVEGEEKEAPKLFMQSRSPMTIRGADRVEHPQPRLLLAVDRLPEELERDQVVINKEVARVKDRHIIGEIECIPDLDVPLSILADTYVTRREVQSCVDADLAKEWLAECESHKHSKSEGDSHGDYLFQSPGFRLIDAEEECLVQEIEKRDYIALSYVWGGLPTTLHPDGDSETKPVLLTTRDNVEGLSKPRGLSSSKVEESGGRIPSTVRNAMEFTRQLGMRYLWVDTLCIVQDDPEDAGRLIATMDDVYANASATLIAASGADADAGLPGVSARTLTSQTPVKIPLPADQGFLNLSTCLPSLSEQVRAAKWRTRGWTFQEQALSRRCLYFTPTELFFSCSGAQLREGYAVEEQECQVEMRAGPPWWTRNLRKDPDPGPYRYLGDGGRLGGMEYQDAVQDYMRKDLTYGDDILNAFEGVFNKFSEGDRDARLSIKKTQGIPAHLLYLGLLWFPSEEAMKRPDITKTKEGALPHFSSWSWASWVGPVDFVYGESGWLSRNISYALRKHHHMHVPTRRWRFAGSSGQTTHEVWSSKDGSDEPENLSRTKTYLTEKIGVDVEKLHGDEAVEDTELLIGELTFYGAHLPSSSVTVEVKEGERIAHIHSSGHKGEFRFDGEAHNVDEFILIVSVDTIRKPADTQSTLLGVTTEDGVSRRAGVGFIYHSKEKTAEHPRWEYKQFRMR